MIKGAPFYIDSTIRVTLRYAFNNQEFVNMLVKARRCVQRMQLVAAVLLTIAFVGGSLGCNSSGKDGAQIMRTPPDTTYTLILAGGLVYDGSGSAPIVTDIGIVGEHILAFGDLSMFDAELRKDVSGLVVSPGFIDIHSHATGSNFRRSGLYNTPTAENYLRQGVTSVIVGQDGTSAFPVGPYLEQIENRPGAINVGTMVGHGTVRAMIMGNRDRAPTETEMDRMRGMVEQAMEEGAFGISSGLEYTPGAYAETEELIALARAMSAYQGLYISHIRDEGGKLLESVAETIRIGEEAGVPTQVTHHKVIGNARWGNSAASLRLIEEARRRGVDAMSDVYPYTASSTGISILFPAWSREGNRAARLERLRDPEKKIFIRNDIVEHIERERGGDPSTIVVASCSWSGQYNGKSLADILQERGVPVTVVNAADLAIELQARGGCMGVFHSMSDEDVTRIMQHPTTMIASDGGIPRFGSGAPHPRNYGSFARVISRYVGELEALSLEEAIHKMSALPARRLGLNDRGVLREGAIADIAVWDQAAVRDMATFESPHQYAEGMKHVFVRGQAVLLDEAVTGKRPGVVLRKARTP